ncbi:MAG: WD40 repeat domain-containing protein [Gammaproteobacteria bacterium]
MEWSEAAKQNISPRIGLSNIQQHNERVSPYYDNDLDAALQRLCHYGLALFTQWKNSGEGWDIKNPHRLWLKQVVEQVLVPFWEQHGNALSVDKSVLSTETVQILQAVMTQFNNKKTLLSCTPSTLNALRERLQATNKDGLPTPLPANATDEVIHAWHKNVEENELILLYDSVHDEKGYLVVPSIVTEVHDEASLNACWQRIGARLLALGWTEKGWRWLISLISAFLSKNHHRAPLAHWRFWLLLLGRALAQSLQTSQQKMAWSPLPGILTVSDAVRYQQILANYHKALKASFLDDVIDEDQVFVTIPSQKRRIFLRHALSQWQEDLYHLVGCMFENAIQLLGEPTTAYCFMLTGSLSRNSAVAYSDVEMALLVEEPVLLQALLGVMSQDVDALAKISAEHRRKALHLLHLLRLVRFHLASLGIEGIALDKSGDPLQDPVLIGTPESFLSSMQETYNKNRGWAYSLMHVQGSRCYSNAAGKILLARYKKAIYRTFTTSIASNGLWQPTQWFLSHQQKNAQQAQRRPADSFDIKAHALKPLTFLIIDVAGLAGLCMDSVPQALAELTQAGYLPQMMTEALLFTWEGLLQWRCYYQLKQTGPADVVTGATTIGLWEATLKEQVAVYLARFYEQLPRLTAVLSPDDDVLSFLERQNRLREQLQVWSTTVALYHSVDSVVADIFFKLSAAFKPSNSASYETFQTMGQCQWGTRWSIPIAQGVYGLLTHADLRLREALIGTFAQGFITIDDKKEVLRKKMTLCVLQTLYPMIYTYWHLTPNTLPTLTLSLLSHLGIALTPLLFPFQTVEEEAWQQVKESLQNNQGCFRWHIFLAEVMQKPFEAGDLPLLSHDGTFEAAQQRYVLPAAGVNQLFTAEGVTIDQSQHGRRQVGEMKYKGHHYHAKFFPELPGVEEAVQVLSQQLQLDGVALSQLFRCPYRIEQKERDPKKQSQLVSEATLGFPLLLSQHVAGQNVQDGLSDDPKAMEKCLSQLHQGHFTRLLLLTLLIHPEDGQPANFILSKTTPDQEGNAYKLTSVDNDHAFVAPWIKVGKDDIQMQIKTLVYCLGAMTQPLDAAVLQGFITQITCLTTTANRTRNTEEGNRSEQVTAVIQKWLETLERRSEAYYHLFTDQERKGLQTPHKKPYQLPLSRGQQQGDAITPLLQLTPQDVGGVYERLERLLEVLSTTEDLNSLTGLNLLQRVCPLVYPCYGVLHQRYHTVQARFQHIGAKQYEETLETDSQTGQTRVRYSSCRTSTLLLQQRGIPDKALVTGVAFRPGELLRRLLDFSVIHYQGISQQLMSPYSPTVKQGEKAYYGLLLDRQRGTVLSRIKHPSSNQQRRLLDYWNGLVVDRMSLLGFTVLNDKLLEGLLQNKPLLHSLYITDSEHLTEAGLKALSRYTPVLNTLVLKRCKQLYSWPTRIFPARLFSVLTSKVPFTLLQLQTLHIERCPLQQLPLITSQLNTLHVVDCPNLVSIDIFSHSDPFSILTLKKLPQLSLQSFRHLLHNTNGQTHLTVNGLSCIETPTRTRALLKALWNVDLNSHYEIVGKSLVDLLISPVLEERSCNESFQGYHGPQPLLLGLDLRRLPLSVDKVSLLIEYYGKKGIQHWQLPSFSAENQGRMLSLVSCRGAKEIMIQSIVFGAGSKEDKLPTALKAHTGAVYTFQVLMDGSVLSGSSDNTLRHWKQESDGEWACASVLKGHTGWVNALQVLPDGSMLSGSNDTTLRHWMYKDDEGWVCVEVLEGHTGYVEALQVLPDGSVVSGSSDWTLCHWVRSDEGEWACASVLKGHTGWVNVLQVLPDGSVLSGSDDSTLRHWVREDNGDWVCASILQGHTGSVYALQVLPDGSVLSGSDDSTLCHWFRSDEGSWACTSILRGHTDAVRVIQVLPDGGVLSGSKDKTLRHWVQKGNGGWACASVLKGYTGSVRALQMLPNGSVLSSSMDNTFCHWSRLSMAVPLSALSEVVQEASHPLPIKVEWKEGKVTVKTLQTSEATFWEAAAERWGSMVVKTSDGIEKQKSFISSIGEKLIATLKALMALNGTFQEEEEAEDNLLAMPFTVEGSHNFPIVIKSEQRTVLLGFMEGLLKGLTPSAVSIGGLLKVYDEAQLALLFDKTHHLESVKIYQLLSYRFRQQLINSQPYLTTLQWLGSRFTPSISVLKGHNDGVCVLQALPEGSVISGSKDKHLRHWVQDGRDNWVCSSVLQGHTSGVFALQMLSDGSLMSGSYDNSLRHWSRKKQSDWMCTSVLHGHTSGVFALQALPDGSVISGSSDTTLRHWECGSDGEWICVSVLEGHTDGVYALQVLPDGSVISGSNDTTLRHWERSRGGEWICGSVLKGHSDRVHVLQALPDGSVVSGSEDKTLCHWIRNSPGKWICESVTKDHVNSVSALQIFPDGNIISIGKDKVLRQWKRDIEKGWVCALTLKDYINGVSSLQLLPDGSVMSGSDDSTLCHWHMPIQYQLSLPTAATIRGLWLSTIASLKDSDINSTASGSWPGCLWTCSIISSEAIEMTVHHTASSEWLTAIKAMGRGIFEGMTGRRTYTVTETRDTVTCLFSISPTLDYLAELQGTLQALHDRIKKGWLTTEINNGAVPVSFWSGASSSGGQSVPLPRKQKARNTRRSMSKEVFTLSHRDSPLKNYRSKLHVQDDSSLLDKAQRYLRNGDELMQGNAIVDALPCYEEGLACLEKLASNGQYIPSESKLYEELSGRIDGVKRLLHQQQEESSEKAMQRSLSGSL